jgi:hypothetical protein
LGNNTIHHSKKIEYIDIKNPVTTRDTGSLMLIKLQNSGADG